MIRNHFATGVTVERDEQGVGAHLRHHYPSGSLTRRECNACFAIVVL